MQKITKLTGIDNKMGRRSRTGSTITMGVDDALAHEAQTYLMALDKGEEPTGRIKRIELVIYDESDMEELNIIESLENRIQELTETLDGITKIPSNDIGVAHLGDAVKTYSDQSKELPKDSYQGNLDIWKGEDSEKDN